MDHFIDIYNKKSKGPGYCQDLLDSDNIKVNLKVDGKPFQVLYNKDTDEVEWHGRSGNETTVGPIIDDYTRLFSKAVNDAIAHLENKTDIIKKFKFLTFEVIDEMLLLTAIIDHSGNFINDAGEIRKVAKSLGTDVMPTLWEGKFSDDQKNTIMQVLSTGIVPTKQDFIGWVKGLFGTYPGFPSKLISAADDFIEGIVFFFGTTGNLTEYKLVDPTYRESMKSRDAGHAADREKFADDYTAIYDAFVDFLGKKVISGSNHVETIQKNYVAFAGSEYYPPALKHMKSINPVRNERYGVQLGRVIPDLKPLLTTDADKSLFELFIKTFYKEKKRAFIISPEFQHKVNTIIRKMQGLNEGRISLVQYIRESMEER